MNGHWLVRILFLGALASISFGLGLFDASNQTLETPEGLDNFSPDDPPLEASDSAEDAKMEDDAAAFDGSDAKSDVFKPNRFVARRKIKTLRCRRPSRG